MRKAIPAIGQSYEHDDLQLSAQRTANWFPEINIETNRALTLQPWPGAVNRVSMDGSGRGFTLWRGKIYKVTGLTLYRVDSDWSVTAIGEIKGSGRCTFPASSEWLVVVSSGRAYTYDGVTLSEVTDSDLYGPDYGAFLRNFWIYQGDTGQLWQHSDAGQPGDINALNFASAESEGDDLVRVYAFDERLYLLGETSIEVWWPDGVGNPKFSRIEGSLIEAGCASADSVSSNDDFMYWLGDDMHVYRLRGSAHQSVSTIPLVREFERYGDVSGAVGYCITALGQQFYLLKVGGKAWCYSQSAGAWFELTYTDSEAAYPGTAFLRAYGASLIEDGGNILELQTGQSLYSGEMVIRERISGLVSGEMFGEEFVDRYIFCSRVDLIIKGVPPLGDAPQIMLSWSDDAGYTWSNERHLDCGKLGDYTFQANTTQLGRFRERVFRIRISDESRYSLHRMTGDFQVGY